MGKIVRYCGDRGTRELIGEVLAGNTAMLRLAASHGLKVSRIPADQGVVRISLILGSKETRSSAA